MSQYADQLYGPELTHNEDSPSDNEDIAAALAQEAEKLRGSEQNPRRFQAINSGAKHVVFIKCRPPVDPVELVHYTLSDVLKTKQHKSRYMININTQTLRRKTRQLNTTQDLRQLFLQRKSCAQVEFEPTPHAF